MVYLYKCAYSNCEMFSDAFPTEERYNGVVFAVKSTIVDKEAMKFEMGDCDDVEDKSERVNDIADGFHYNQVQFSKPQFTAWLKPYVKKLAEKFKEANKDDEEKQKLFQTSCGEYAKFILGIFDKCEFYLNEDNDMDGSVAVGYWQDEQNDKGPTFLYFKEGLVREKI